MFPVGQQENLWHNSDHKWIVCCAVLCCAVLCMCVCVRVGGYLHICLHTLSKDYFGCPSSFADLMVFMKWVLSVTWNSSSNPDWISGKSREFTGLCLSSLMITSTHHLNRLLKKLWGSNAHPHFCQANTFMAELSPHPPESGISWK